MPSRRPPQKPGAEFAEIIENIDIGGPSMVRSAAKNFEDVAIVTAASDYPALVAELAAEQRRTEPCHPLGLAKKPPSPPPLPTTPPSPTRSRR